MTIERAERNVILPERFATRRNVEEVEPGTVVQVRYSTLERLIHSFTKIRHYNQYIFFESPDRIRVTFVRKNEFGEEYEARQPLILEREQINEGGYASILSSPRGLFRREGYEWRESE